MDTPQYDNNPAFELPPVKEKQRKSAEGQNISYEVPKGGGEQAPAHQEQASQPPQTQPPATPVQPPVTDDNASTATSSSATSPQIADDTDLIEKEWVEKAKEIVARTSKNPHQQNIEMSKFKADYVKKRYNKDLKLDAA